MGRLYPPRAAIAAFVACLMLSSVPASAAPAAVRLRAAIGGQLHGVPGNLSEEVVFHTGLVPALLAVHLDRAVRVTAWPVAPGLRADVDLTRFDVYAPGAKIFGFRNGRLVEVGRSRLVFFKGRAVGDERRELLVTIDPDTRELSGFVESPAGRSEFRPLAHRAGNRYRVADPDLFLTPAERASQNNVSCGQELLPAPPRSLFEALAEPASGQHSTPLRSLSEAAITTMHQAVIAVDTDSEFFYRKWGVKTTAQYQANATNYLASLIAGMTVIYERDFLVRLAQGTTFLRTPPAGAESNFATDPYGQAGTGANVNQLTEFSNYWAAGCGGTCSGVARALAMMISGKSGGGASGIAWLTSLCSASYGYSFSQVFINTSTVASVSEVRLVGHELGHNFGSPHSHCYSPPIDGCYNAQSGCYSGATSCPASTTMNGVANVTGTIMSYCHHLGGCTASSVFHPTSVSLLEPKIQNAVNQCIFPVSASSPMVLSAVAPKTGSTAGGTPLTITGSGFVAGGALAVSVGGVAATNVVRQSATTLTAIAPAHATGTVSIAVTNGSGGAAQTLTNSYFYAPPASSSWFYTLVPCRVLDTRNPTSAVGGPALAPGADRLFPVTGCGVPADAKSISANLTAIDPPGQGALSVFPGNAIYLGTGDVSFRANVSRANNALVLLATDATGTIKVRNLAAFPVHFVLDVNGYFR